MIPDFKNSSWEKFEEDKTQVINDTNSLIASFPSKFPDDGLNWSKNEVIEYYGQIQLVTDEFALFQKNIKCINSKESFCDQIKCLEKQIKKIKKVSSNFEIYLKNNVTNDESTNVFCESCKNLFDDLEILNEDIKNLLITKEKSNLNPHTYGQEGLVLKPHTYGQEDIPLENIQEKMKHPSQVPKFPDLPSLLLPKVLSKTRVNSTRKQIERANILLDSLKEVLDWRYGNLIKSNQGDTPSSKKVVELHQSIQYFQSYINGMDKGAIQRSYGDECIDMSNQIKKVFANNLKPEEKSHTKEFFSKTIKELTRLDAKFKSL